MHQHSCVTPCVNGLLCHLNEELPPNLQVTSKSFLSEFSSKKYISNTEAHHEAALNKSLDTNLWEKKTVKSLKSRSLSLRSEVTL